MSSWSKPSQSAVAGALARSKTIMGVLPLGTLNHLAMEQFRGDAGFEAVVAHYRGIAPAILPVMFEPFETTKPGGMGMGPGGMGGGSGADAAMISGVAPTTT